jgi:hypothetical protein
MIRRFCRLSRCSDESQGIHATHLLTPEVLTAETRWIVRTVYMTVLLFFVKASLLPPETDKHPAPFDCCRLITSGRASEEPS